MSEVTDPALLEQLNRGLHDPREPAKPPARPGINIMGKTPGDAVDLLHGISQGILDPIEGIIQLAEKSTGWKMAPDSVKNWARDWRKRSRETWMGVGGEGLGIVGPGLMGGAAATGAGMLGRAASGAILAAAQPVEGGGDYWRTKANQATFGGMGGAALPALAGQVARAAAPVSNWARALPPWARPFGHMIGAPAIPLSGLAQRAANVPGGTYGAGAGELAGSYPTGEPSGITIRPITDQPAPPAPPRSSPEPEEEPPAQTVDRSRRGEPLRMRRSEE